MTALQMPSEAKRYSSVAKAGSSLFPAIAAALVSTIAFEKGLEEKSASTLLKAYLTRFPKEQTTLSRLSALEQWKAMIRPSGAAVKVSIHLARVLQQLCYQHFEKNPGPYIYAINGLNNFDENNQRQAETTSAQVMLSVAAELCNITIVFHQVDGQKTLASSLCFNEGAAHTVQIHFDKALNEFQPYIKHGERFKSMRGCALPDENATPQLNLSFFIHSLQTSMEEIIHRYAVMVESDEISETDLLALYIDGYHHEVLIPGDLARNTSVGDEHNYSSALPPYIETLIHAIAWQESCKALSHAALSTIQKESSEYMVSRSMQ